MNKKGMYIFRVILGGYLGYLGINLLVQTTKEKPSNMIFMSAMGVLFIVVGLAYAIISMKRVFDLRKEESSDENPVETKEGVAYREEGVKRQINMQTVGTEQKPGNAEDQKDDTDGKPSDRKEQPSDKEKQPSDTDGQETCEGNQKSDGKDQKVDEKDGNAAGEDRETAEEIENDYEEK